MRVGPSDAYRQDQRIDKLEDKVENLARAVEGINRAIAEARAAVVTRHQPYIGAGNR